MRIIRHKRGYGDRESVRERPYLVLRGNLKHKQAPNSRRSVVD